MNKLRARGLGIPFEGTPGEFNAITDVSGVTVGYSTIIEGTDARTGVTIIHPRGRELFDPVYAGVHSFNGNGEVTGTLWIEEGGLLEGPIGLTNTHSVGVVRDAIVKWQVRNDFRFQKWCMPIVAETADAWLNNMDGFFVKEEHVFEALDSAASGAIAEGGIGGGTGMMCYEFKGGTGTSSRRLPEKSGGWTVGALAQTNFGRREYLTIAGVPVGKHIKNENKWHVSGEDPNKQDDGSLIVVVGTDAPLLPHQLKRVARRVSLGMARTGSIGGNGSGDIFIAFSTANPNATKPGEKGLTDIQTVVNDHLDPIFEATVYATEEAIINSLVAARDMTGHEISVKALPHDDVRELLKKYNRLP
ncbi:MAG: P1 family peptidase [Anaerolineales bacterium]|nr:MAG: S58 family peptidase [Chloroflexota bacterium]MCE7861203.1 S58 family peptidase [Chloroflexi bacterium CFX2]MCK6581891.1 P1 family peptidase [Anaerolineales bacterium]